MFEPSLIETISGRFMFVGSVPASLCYVDSKGQPLASLEIEKQLRLPSNFRTMKNRTFESRAQAWTAYREFSERGEK